MILLDDIITAYGYGIGNNPNSPDQVEFGMHWQAGCISVYNDIVNRSLRLSAYSFVKLYPCPREIFGASVYCRILAYYLDMRLRPILDANISTHVWSNRVGRGSLACQNAVMDDIYEVSRGYTRPATVVKYDIKGCFPHIVRQIAYEQMVNLVERDYHGRDKDELLYILRMCLLSSPALHCAKRSPLAAWKHITDDKSIFKQEDGIGAVIGFLPWQNAVNYYFTPIDRYLESQGIIFERYMDDTYIIAENTDILLILPEIRKRLGELGATMHPTKFYCQPVSHGVECLGRHLKMDRAYPNDRPIRHALHRIKQYNRRIRPGRIFKLINTVNSYLGICKNGCGYNQARKIIGILDRRWFNYVYFDEKKMVLRPLPEYSERNQIIHRFNLL